MEGESVSEDKLKMKRIGRLGMFNTDGRVFYGCLAIHEIKNKYYWGVEDEPRMSLQEIPKYLYDALNKFEEDKP